MTRGRNRTSCTPRRAISAVPHTDTSQIPLCPSAAPPRYLPSKPITSFHGWFLSSGRASYPAPKLRRILRRSHRTRNRHFSHTPAISLASAPHAHVGPLRHPFNLRPILITSCQHSLAFRKVRSAKNAASPDTIGSGNTAFPFGQPRLIPVDNGAARLYSVVLPGPIGPGPCRIQSRTGRGLVGNRCGIGI
jgi:hypothetical protein